MLSFQSPIIVEDGISKRTRIRDLLHPKSSSKLLQRQQAHEQTVGEQLTILQCGMEPKPLLLVRRQLRDRVSE